VKKEFRLPDVGEGLTEADIVSWHVKPGDTVTINQIIVDIETAKAVVELPSPYAGTVSALLVDEGQTVDVGTPIIAVDVPRPAGAEPETTAPEPEAAQAPEAGQAPAVTDAPKPPARQPVLVGYGVKPGSTSRRPRKKPSTRPGSYPATPSAPPTSAPPFPPTGKSSAGGPTFPAGIKLPPGIPAPPQFPGASRALAKPPVRRLARDLGVNLGGLAGSGPAGSVTREDVERAASEASSRSAVADAVPGDRPRVVADLSPGQAAGSAATDSSSTEERIPVRGVRKHTAAAMVASAFTAPHVTEFLQVDVTETMAAVRRARDLPEFAAVKVSPLLFVAKALLVAVRRHPMINSSWDEAAQEIVVKRPVNLGIAVAAERGLLVPNVKGADALPLAGLAQAIDGLAATARAGKTTPADLAGGTITITNVGVFGVDAGTPILMPGEAAILAFGQVRDLPWVVSGELAVRKVTTLSLSFDHRIVDGELGSAVLRDVGSMLEDPMRMLAWS
jgi:pyruvate dehydrogenase E2 component (dihydrolipoamide acetyltransferase)